MIKYKLNERVYAYGMIPGIIKNIGDYGQEEFGLKQDVDGFYVEYRVDLFVYHDEQWSWKERLVTNRDLNKRASNDPPLKPDDHDVRMNASSIEHAETLAHEFQDHADTYYFELHPDLQSALAESLVRHGYKRPSVGMGAPPPIDISALRMGEEEEEEGWDM